MEEAYSGRYRRLDVCAENRDGDEARAKAKAKRVIGRTAPPRFVLYSENSITKPEVTILVPMPSGAVKAQAVSPINWRIADR